MAIEIERRFLVKDPGAAIAAAHTSVSITQGYFGRALGCSVRVRLQVDEAGIRKGLLTFKGRRHGCCRLEFEYLLAPDQAEQALAKLSPEQLILKTRYLVPGAEGLVWAVDRFEGRNCGLVLAEVELETPHQWVEMPDWLGQEITSDRRYGNSRLARTPVVAHAVAA